MGSLWEVTHCRRLCTKIIVAPLASLVLPSCRPLADGAPFKHLRREYKGTYTSLPEARAEYASKIKAAARRQARACACTPCRVPPVHYTCTCVLQTTFTLPARAPAHTAVCTCTHCMCALCVHLHLHLHILCVHLHLHLHRHRHLHLHLPIHLDLHTYCTPAVAHARGRRLWQVSAAGHVSRRHGRWCTHGRRRGCGMRSRRGAWRPRRFCDINSAAWNDMRMCGVH